MLGGSSLCRLGIYICMRRKRRVGLLRCIDGRGWEGMGGGGELIDVAFRFLCIAVLICRFSVFDSGFRIWISILYFMVTIFIEVS